jgi:PAS domain S-box-containing protein
MPLRALLDRSDIPEDAKNAIREELERQFSASAPDADRRRIQRDLALDLLAAESLEEALRVCLRGALDASGLDVGGIYLVSTDAQDLELVCYEGASDEWADEVRSVRANSAHGKRVLSGRSECLTWERLRTLKDLRVVTEGLRALATIPVVYRDEVIACLNLASRTDDRISVGRQHTLELIGGLLGVVVKRFQVAQDLQQSETRYRALVESAPDAIFTVGPDGRFLTANRAAAHALGREPAAVVGRHMQELFPAAIATRQLSVIERVLRTGTPYGTFGALTTTAAGPRSFNTVLSPVVDPDGRVVCVLGVARDITDHQTAVEALRQSEERYRALVESAPDAIFTVDTHGTILSVNPAAARVLRLPDGEAVGRSLRDVFPSPLAEHRIGIIRGIHETGERAIATYTENVEGQGERWFSAVLSPVFGPDREVLCVLGIARDITEQVEADQALRESEARYRTLIEAAPDAILTVDRDGVVLSVNAEMARRLGGGSDQVVGRRFHDLMPADGADQRLAWVRQAFDTGMPVAARDRGRVPGYEDRWYEAIHAPIRDADGTVRQVLVVSRDVTERVRAEEALRQSEERYALATAAGKVAVWDWRPEDGPPLCSPALEEMLGYGPEEVFSDWQDWDRIRHPDDRERMREISRSISDGQVTEFAMEQRLLHKDGMYHWIFSRGTAIRHPDGRIVRLLGTSTDTTEQKRAEEERRKIAERLQQASKLESLGLLAGGVAHDFSNLLTGLLGNIELARRQTDAASTVHTYLERAEQAATQAAGLADQMLAYAGRGRVVIRTLDFAALVRDTGGLAAAQCPAQVQVVLAVPQELPAIRGDATQLRQVALNLVTNAAESLGEAGGVVTAQVGVVDVDRDYLAHSHVDDNLPVGRYVSLRVSDTGPGMDAETLARIFDPFFTTKATGRGFGLASALAVARGHGGAMLVTSEPGSGTTFEVLLPAVEGAAEADGLDDCPPAPLAQGTGVVLVAEDEPLVLAVAAATLSEAGFTVLEAADGSEALRLFEENAAELCAVFLDLAMPKVDGLQVLREIRHRRPELPAIVTSAYVGDEAAARLQGGGPTVFVRKPYRTEQLVTRLLEAIHAPPT